MSAPTSTGRRGYATVHRSWLADPRLSSTGLHLMLWLESHSDEYLSALDVKRSAKEIGWSRARVIRAIEELEGLGLISTEIVPHGAGKRTRFTLHLTDWTEPDRVSKRDTPVTRNETHPVYRNETPTTSNRSCIETNSQEIAQRTQFDEFWELYPRRVAKADALKAWRQMPQHERALAIVAVPHHVALWRAEGRGTRVVPYPATWLRRESWNDELGYIPERPAGAGSVMDRIRRATGSVDTVSTEVVR